MSQLTAILIDWNGFLKDPRFLRRDLEITWVDAAPMISQSRLTRRDVADLARSGQFSFRIADDDSLLQIAYRFDREGSVEAARLAFYEVGDFLYDEEIEVFPAGELEDPFETARWIRFDYCHSGQERVLHMDSHLHFSSFPNVRFAVTGIPTPKQFIEFVVSHFYPTTY